MSSGLPGAFQRNALGQWALGDKSSIALAGADDFREILVLPRAKPRGDMVRADIVLTVILWRAELDSRRADQPDKAVLGAGIGLRVGEAGLGRLARDIDDAPALVPPSPSTSAAAFDAEEAARQVHIDHGAPVIGPSRPAAAS